MPVCSKEAKYPSSSPVIRKKSKIKLSFVKQMRRRHGFRQRLKGLSHYFYRKHLCKVRASESRAAHKPKLPSTHCVQKVARWLDEGNSGSRGHMTSQSNQSSFNSQFIVMQGSLSESAASKSNIAAYNEKPKSKFKEFRREKEQSFTSHSIKSKLCKRNHPTRTSTERRHHAFDSSHHTSSEPLEVPMVITVTDRLQPIESVIPGLAHLASAWETELSSCTANYSKYTPRVNICHDDCSRLELSGKELKWPLISSSTDKQNTEPKMLLFNETGSDFEVEPSEVDLIKCLHLDSSPSSSSHSFEKPCASFENNEACIPAHSEGTQPAQLSIEMDEDIENNSKAVALLSNSKTVFCQFIFKFAQSIELKTCSCLKLLGLWKQNVLGSIYTESVSDHAEHLICVCHDKICAIMETLEQLSIRRILLINSEEQRRLWLLHDTIVCSLQAFKCLRNEKPFEVLHSKFLNLLMLSGKILKSHSEQNTADIISTMVKICGIQKVLNDKNAWSPVCQCRNNLFLLNQNITCQECGVNELFKDLCESKEESPGLLGMFPHKVHQLKDGIFNQLLPRISGFLEILQNMSLEELSAKLQNHTLSEFSCNPDGGLYPCEKHCSLLFCNCFCDQSAAHEPSISCESIYSFESTCASLKNEHSKINCAQSESYQCCAEGKLKKNISGSQMNYLDSARNCSSAVNGALGGSRETGQVSGTSLVLQNSTEETRLVTHNSGDEGWTLEIQSSSSSDVIPFSQDCVSNEKNDFGWSPKKIDLPKDKNSNDVIDKVALVLPENSVSLFETGSSIETKLQTVIHDESTWDLSNSDLNKSTICDSKSFCSAQIDVKNSGDLSDSDMSKSTIEIDSELSFPKSLGHLNTSNCAAYSLPNCSQSSSLFHLNLNPDIETDQTSFCCNPEGEPLKDVEQTIALKKGSSVVELDLESMQENESCSKLPRSCDAVQELLKVKLHTRNVACKVGSSGAKAAKTNNFQEAYALGLDGVDSAGKVDCPTESTCYTVYDSEHLFSAVNLRKSHGDEENNLSCHKKCVSSSSKSEESQPPSKVVAAQDDKDTCCSKKTSAKKCVAKQYKARPLKNVAQINTQLTENGKEKIQKGNGAQSIATVTKRQRNKSRYQRTSPSRDSWESNLYPKRSKSSSLSSEKDSNRKNSNLLVTLHKRSS